MAPHRSPASLSPSRFATLLSGLAAAALAACGGGGDAPPAPAALEVAAAPATADAAADPAPGAEARPTFHMAPAQLDEPGAIDADGHGLSALEAPHRFEIDDAVAGLSTARLTPERLAAARRARVASAGGARPSATAITAAVYTPAQIRAAYGLPPLPAVEATLSAATAATFGAGQTIYIVDAFHHPNAFADLATFSAKFGLARCASVALPATSALPLPKAGSNCTFSVAYTDGKAAPLAAAPAYNAEWVGEIALDVQWAHAIAPLARIVLIEVSDANSNSLLGGVVLANRMGAGVVAMSFGAPEGAWVRSNDASLAAAGMTYVAAAGDNGAQALWPAVSPRVLAVGGTSLQWNGFGTRYEAAWAGSGGGASAFEPVPAWQSSTVVPGAGVATMRTVSDVAFNADPATGQYVALTVKGAASPAWYAYGGTSIGVPQWAGLVAIANARRAAASRAPLGDFHATLYKTVAGTPGTYASAFADVVDGRDGSCATCAAASGYDAVTGWGTPNAGALLDVLASDAAASLGVVAVNHAPTLASTSVSLRAGAALKTTLAGKDADGDALTYTMPGAPAGMTLSAAGTLAWARAARGIYAPKITVRDSKGLAGAAATVTIVVAG